MQIWVDADACPNMIKAIIYKAAERKQIITTFVANQLLSLPRSNYLRLIRVAKGFDQADNAIIELINAGDLVITADIPLANEVLNKQANVITPRGERFDLDTIKQRLIMRDFMETLRASGVQSDGPPAMSVKDRERFANQLQQYIR
jgi:uncharacterized protein